MSGLPPQGWSQVHVAADVCRAKAKRRRVNPSSFQRKQFEPTRVGCCFASRRPVTGGTHNANPCLFTLNHGKIIPKIYLRIFHSVALTIGERGAKMSLAGVDVSVG